MVISGFLGGTFLASYASFGGGSFGNILAQWEAAGVFTYILPFLLIFSLIFVILSNVKIFKDNKGVNAVISIAVAFMALQFNIVSIFFAEIFPRLGIALSVVLVILILGSLFIDPDNKSFKWIIVVGILIVMGFVIFGALGAYGTGVGNIWYWIQSYGGQVLIWILVAAAIIGIIAGTSPKAKAKLPNIKVPVWSE